MELYQDTHPKNTTSATSPDGPYWPPVEGASESRSTAARCAVATGSEICRRLKRAMLHLELANARDRWDFETHNRIEKAMIELGWVIAHLPNVQSEPTAASRTALGRTTEICQPMKNATTKPKRTRNRLGSRELVRLIDGKPYGVRPRQSDPCPFCGHGSTVGLGDPRSYGFRKTTQRRHVFSCYEKALAKLGWREGVYDPEHDMHPLEPNDSYQPTPGGAASKQKESSNEN